MNNMAQMGGQQQVMPSQGWANYGSTQGLGYSGALQGSVYPPSPQPLPTQQGPQTPFTGRFISDVSEVVPSEVPMDGRAALFPNRSLEEVYLKMWNRDGQLKTFRYILDPTQNLNAQAPSQQEDTQNLLLQRIDELEAKINSMTQSSEEPAQRKNSKGGEK